MINYIQSNQTTIVNTNVIDNIIFDNITNLIKSNNLKKFEHELRNISHIYNIYIKIIINNYFNYIIRYK